MTGLPLLSNGFNLGLGQAATMGITPRVDPRLLQQLQSGLAAQQAATVASSPSVSPDAGTPLANAWPTPRNEQERIIMLNTGMIDPNYASPLQKTLAQSYGVRDAADTMAAQAVANRSAPMVPRYRADGSLANPEQVLQAQTVGPLGGDVTRVLRSLQGGDNTTILPPTIRRPVDPYLPQAGYGKIDLAGGAVDTLDRNVYFDPEFQKMMVQNPEKAKFVYQKLTNRDLATDAKTATDLRQTQIKTGFDFAKQQIQQGAKFDPNTNRWKVWAQAEPPEGGGFNLSSDPRPYRQLVDATDEQNQFLNQHYSNVMGQKLPQRTIKTTLMTDPVVASAVTATEAQLGRKLSAQEADILAQRTQTDIRRNEEQVRNARFFGDDTYSGKALNAVQDFSDFLLGGTRPVPTQLPPEARIPYADGFRRAPVVPAHDEQTWWGRLMQNMPVGGGF